MLYYNFLDSVIIQLINLRSLFSIQYILDCVKCLSTDWIDINIAPKSITNILSEIDKTILVVQMICTGARL